MDCSRAGGGSEDRIRQLWPEATTVPPLGERDVQVWCAVLDRPDHETRIFTDWLSPEEKARATGAATDLLRRRFIARRGLVRGLMGQAVGRSPRDVVFQVGEEGKPSVENAAGLSFAVSHSGPMALVAMARGHRLGVDIECRRPRKDLEGLARRTFCPNETEALLALPPDTRMEAFYRVWTRKEALAKAVGMGIASSFHRFSVSLGPAEGSRVLHMDLPGESADAWVLLDLEPVPGYSGTLAVENARDLVPTLWSLPCPPDRSFTVLGTWNG